MRFPFLSLLLVVSPGYAYRRKGNVEENALQLPIVVSPFHSPPLYLPTFLGAGS